MPTPAAMMVNVAALLNDAAQQLFTNTTQLPYFNLALREMREMMQQYNIAYFNSTTSTTVAAGVTSISSFPTDLVEIRQLLERDSGSTEDYIPMTRLEYLPPVTTTTASLVYWTWQGQVVKFLGATSPREVLFEYTSNTLSDVTSTTSTTNISVINIQGYLENRTAALCAQFIGENVSRAADLNTQAQMAWDRFLSINLKGKQSIAVRRQPFRAAWRSRGLW